MNWAQQEQKVIYCTPFSYDIRKESVNDNNDIIMECIVTAGEIDSLGNREKVLRGHIRGGSIVEKQFLQTDTVKLSQSLATTIVYCRSRWEFLCWWKRQTHDSSTITNGIAGSVLW